MNAVLRFAGYRLATATATAAVIICKVAGIITAANQAEDEDEYPSTISAETIIVAH